jgi:hypothetical protein
LLIAWLIVQIARSIRRFAFPCSSSRASWCDFIRARRNPLHEVKDALGVPIFLTEDGFDDFRGIGFVNVASRLAELAVEVLF